MYKDEYGDWCGTVKDLKEWLEQFDDEDAICFSGGFDSDDDWGGEFMDVLVNNKVVA